MNKHLLDIYALGVVACGGFGAVTGVYNCLETCDLIPNNRDGHQYVKLDKNIPFRDGLTALGTCAMCCAYGVCGGCIGVMAGLCSPLFIPVYGLIKIRNKYRYVSDNEIKE